MKKLIKQTSNPEKRHEKAVKTGKIIEIELSKRKKRIILLD